MEEYGLHTEQDITFKEIKEELIKGLNAFSVKPIGVIWIYKGKE